jgi:hypothetical protein
MTIDTNLNQLIAKFNRLNLNPNQNNSYNNATVKDIENAFKQLYGNVSNTNHEKKIFKALFLDMLSKKKSGNVDNYHKLSNQLHSFEPQKYEAQATLKSLIKTHIDRRDPIVSINSDDKSAVNLLNAANKAISKYGKVVNWATSNNKSISLNQLTRNVKVNNNQYNLKRKIKSMNVRTFNKKNINATKWKAKGMDGLNKNNVLHTLKKLNNLTEKYRNTNIDMNDEYKNNTFRQIADKKNIVQQEFKLLTELYNTISRNDTIKFCRMSRRTTNQQPPVIVSLEPERKKESLWRKLDVKKVLSMKTTERSTISGRFINRYNPDIVIVQEPNNTVNLGRLLMNDDMLKEINVPPNNGNNNLRGTIFGNTRTIANANNQSNSNEHPNLPNTNIKMKFPLLFNDNTLNNVLNNKGNNKQLQLNKRQLQLVEQLSQLMTIIREIYQNTKQWCWSRIVEIARTPSTTIPILKDVCVALLSFFKHRLLPFILDILKFINQEIGRTYEIKSVVIQFVDIVKNMLSNIDKKEVIRQSLEAIIIVGSLLESVLQTSFRLSLDFYRNIVIPMLTATRRGVLATGRSGIVMTKTVATGGYYTLTRVPYALSHILEIGQIVFVKSSILCVTMFKIIFEMLRNHNNRLLSAYNTYKKLAEINYIKYTPILKMVLKQFLNGLKKGTMSVFELLQVIALTVNKHSKSLANFITTLLSSIQIKLIVGQIRNVLGVSISIAHRILYGALALTISMMNTFMKESVIILFGIASVSGSALSDMLSSLMNLLLEAHKKRPGKTIVDMEKQPLLVNTGTPNNRPPYNTLTSSKIRYRTHNIGRVSGATGLVRGNRFKNQLSVVRNSGVGQFERPTTRSVTASARRGTNRMVPNQPPRNNSPVRRKRTHNLGVVSRTQGLVTGNHMKLQRNAIRNSSAKQPNRRITRSMV